MSTIEEVREPGSATTTGATARLSALRACTPAMLDALATLVETESPSSDVAAVERCAEMVAHLGAEQLREPPAWSHDANGRPILHWRFGEPRVVLIGHLDTVWPVGTTQRWRWSVDGDVASGPGAFDMKAGIVQGLFALSTLDDLDGVHVILNGDEEIGSPGSRELVEASVAGARAALVLEPSAEGALKIARKGVSLYELTASGRAAHAGLEPERGVNALIALAQLVLEVGSFADSSVGTTVTPTVAAAGTTVNTVPAQARASVDVRAASRAEQQRVDQAIRELQPRLAGARLAIGGGINRPPLEPMMSRELFDRARAVAAMLRLAPLRGVAVGGGSDGNYTAAAGVPTLDGLGAVGGNAHAEGEHVVVSAMAERAALVACLVEELR